MTINTNVDFYEGVNLHDWEGMLEFFTWGSPTGQAAQSCKDEVLKQIQKHGNDIHPGRAYAESLCAAIAKRINRTYPTIDISWHITPEETSLSLSCDGYTKQVGKTYDYLDFLNMLTGLDDLYDILEAVYNYDLADATETEAEWMNSSETLKLIRSVGVEEAIEKFYITNIKTLDKILTASGTYYIVDDYPQKTLAVALAVKEMIYELTEGSTTKLSCSESKFAFVVDVELKNGSQHRITCFDDMSELMRESVTL